MKILKMLKRAFRYVVKGIPENKISAEIFSIAPNELLKGRVALITGGTSGIGYSIAQAFLRSGASVIITGRNQEKLTRACDFLKTISQNNVYGFVLDNGDVCQMQTSFDKITNETKDLTIDVLVNNAGVCGGDIATVSEEEFDTIINTNLKGVFFLSRIVGEYMKKNKIRGNILNIASSSSLRPAASAYTLSKWGIRGFTLGLAKTLAPYGITVNGLAPGPTATPMLGRDSSDITFQANPMGRFAMPEEIADMAVVLVSRMSRMVVGDVVYMTGGAGLITMDDVPYNF